MKLYNQLIKYLSDEIHNPKSIRWFRVALYIVLLYQTIVLCLPISDYLWGSESWINPVRSKNTWTYNFFMALHNVKWEQYYSILIGIQLLGIGLGLLRKFTYLANVLVYVSTVLLFNRAYLIMTGGNYLIHILLFFMLFMNESGKRQGINAFLTNVFHWACKIQLLVVYFFSAIYKLTGSVWRDGESLHYLMNMEEFSLPFLTGNLEDFGGLLVLGTYISLLYQMLFPVLVWVKRIKIPFLMIGVGFHLITIFVMGVPLFGITMIVSYFLFLSDDELARLFAGKPH